jgi:hypothetical protein
MARFTRTKKPDLKQQESRVEYPSDWTQLLNETISRPGIVNQAYSAFYSYSFGNQIRIMMQCLEREIEIGPAATFNRWKQLGRVVAKGQKALIICMPNNRKLERVNRETGESEEVRFTSFSFRPAHGRSTSRWKPWTSERCRLRR